MLKKTGKQVIRRYIYQATLDSPQGSDRIVVRATDKTGKVQTAEVRPPFPDGNTGYHSINI